jgi:hypothetical protein
MAEFPTNSLTIKALGAAVHATLGPLAGQAFNDLVAELYGDAIEVLQIALPPDMAALLVATTLVPLQWRPGLIQDRLAFSGAVLSRGGSLQVLPPEMTEPLGGFIAVDWVEHLARLLTGRDAQAGVQLGSLEVTDCDGALSASAAYHLADSVLVVHYGAPLSLTSAAVITRVPAETIKRTGALARELCAPVAEGDMPPVSQIIMAQTEAAFSVKH